MYVHLVRRHKGEGEEGGSFLAEHNSSLSSYMLVSVLSLLSCMDIICFLPVVYFSSSSVVLLLRLSGLVKVSMMLTERLVSAASRVGGSFVSRRLLSLLLDGKKGEKREERAEGEEASLPLLYFSLG